MRQGKDREKTQNNKLSGYELTRAWFDFAFENPHQVSINHGYLYLWLVELNNRLGWVPKFGIPRTDTMNKTGIKNNNTYTKVFSDLVAWGFIKLIQKAKNRYTSNIITLCPPQKSGKHLDSSLMSQSHLYQIDNTTESYPYQSDNGTDNATDNATDNGTVCIIKPLNNKTNKPLNPEGDKSPGTKTLFTSLKNIFLIEYRNQTDAEYYFEAKDGKNLNQLIAKITHSLKTSGETPTSEQIISAWEYILKNHGNKWLNSNFSIPNFNSKYNETISGIKKRGNGATEREIADIVAKHFATDYPGR